MKAVRCIENQARVVSVPAPTGEGVRVKVASAGICGSDLHLIAMWPLEATLGHEFAGLPERRHAGCGRAARPVLGVRSLPQRRLSPVRAGRGHGPRRRHRWRHGRRVPRARVGDRRAAQRPFAVATPASSNRSRSRSTASAAATCGWPRRVAIVGGGAIGLVWRRGRTRDRRASRSRRAARRTACGRSTARRGHVVGDDASSAYDVVIDAAGTTESLQQCIHLAKPGRA